MIFRNDIIEFYDRNSKNYSTESSYRFYSDLTKLICDAVAKKVEVPSLIIDIGSGCGFSTGIIAKRFPGTPIVAVEPASSFHEMARERYPSNAVEFKNCRLADLNDGRKADLLISNMSYHWLLDDDRKNLLKVMRSDAIVAMALPVRPASMPSKRFRGNSMLVETYRELAGGNGFVSPAKTLRGSRPGERSDGELEIVSETLIDVIEEFSTADFSDDLYYRGLLTAIFGDLAGLARGILERRSRGFSIIEYCWSVAIRLVRKSDLTANISVSHLQAQKR